MDVEHRNRLTGRCGLDKVLHLPELRDADAFEVHDGARSFDEVASDFRAYGQSVGSAEKVEGQQIKGVG